MYHNELCNFPSDFLNKKPCDSSCEYWLVCTRKNSYSWEKFLQGAKHHMSVDTVEQTERDCMDRQTFKRTIYRQHLLQDIKNINKILGGMKNEE